MTDLHTQMTVMTALMRSNDRDSNINYDRVYDRDYDHDYDHVEHVQAGTISL